MHSRLYGALAVFVGLGLSGCAGTSVTPGPSAASGAALYQRAPALRAKHDKASYKRALYIADLSRPNVKVLTNTYYRDLGVITNGISQPLAESMDKLGNLYVANFSIGSSLGDVTEYAPGGTSPSFTYNANMNFPAGVTVDRHDNVYEADSNVYGPGSINEYFQGVNAVSQSCSVPNYDQPSGVAVDASGDVFVASYNGIYEYNGGLSGCSPTLLNSIPTNAIVVDSNNNLIISEVSPRAVGLLEPPYYNIISSTIGSGFSAPTGLSINKKNKLVYVADLANNTVTVINYQTGQNVKVISGASYGIEKTQAVVDAPNAVY